MPGMDGMDLLKKVQSKDPDVSVVLSMPLPAAESAKTALRGGAFDSITKPFDSDELNAVVTRAVEMSALQRENRKLREQLDVASIAAGFVAEAPQSRQLTAMIRRVAPSRTTALIEGETGTGKELVARMLHTGATAPTVRSLAINCKALADGVVESELFGHEKGSFTGAIRERRGCSSAPRAARCFSTRSARQAPTSRPSCCACSRTARCCASARSKTAQGRRAHRRGDQPQSRREVAAGTFRADLYFRLNVIPLKIAAAARAPRRHPAAGAALPRLSFDRGRPSADARRRRPKKRSRLLVAGQRARAART